MKRNNLEKLDSVSLDNQASNKNKGILRRLMLRKEKFRKAILIVLAPVGLIGVIQGCGPDFSSGNPPDYNDGGAGGEGANVGNGGAVGGCEPTGPELCDGLDNDCKNGVDDNPTPEECPLNTGVCLDSHLSRTCNNAQWTECQSIYETKSEYVATELTAAHCDDIDNDCNGTIDDNGDSPIHGCLTVLGETGLFEFLANPNNTTLNPLPESTGDGTCGNSDVTTMTGPGQINVIWRFGGNSENDIKIRTKFPPTTMHTGCSVEAQLNCPTNQQMWDDYKNMIGLETILPTLIDGDEYTYESQQSCGRHVFIIEN